MDETDRFILAWIVYRRKFLAYLVSGKRGMEG